MATFSNPQGIFGLQATATPVGTDVSGSQTVGVPPRLIQFAGAAHAYSLKIIAATTNNSAAVYVPTGVAAVVAGTPVIYDGDGRDCEGVTLPTMSDLYGYIIRTGTTNAGTVNVSSAGDIYPTSSTLGSDCQFIGIFNSVASPGTTITFQFTTGGDSAYFTAVGVV